MFDTIISVDVIDRNGRHIPGASVTWRVTYKGKSIECGPVFQGERPAEIQIASELDEPYVTITASYEGASKTERIKADKRHHTIKLVEVHVPKPENEPEGPSGLIDILNAARRAVPAVNYALGVVGVAAAGALIILILGYGRGAVIVLGGLLIAMLLLFAFARLAAVQNPWALRAGVLLLWAGVVFFCVFLLFTATAVAVAWPCNWARFLSFVETCPR
jgi:hypothetical protein